MIVFICDNIYIYNYIYIYINQVIHDLQEPTKGMQNYSRNYIVQQNYRWLHYVGGGVHLTFSAMNDKSVETLTLKGIF